MDQDARLDKRKPSQGLWDILFDCCCKKQVIDPGWHKLKVVEGSVLMERDLIMNSVNSENLECHFNAVKKQKLAVEKALQNLDPPPKESPHKKEKQEISCLTVKPQLVTSQLFEEPEEKNFVTNFRKSSLPVADQSRESRKQHLIRSIDVDEYLKNVKLGDYYLVKHLGRGMFVKFTEKHLKINKQLYAKGRSQKPPADMPEHIKKYFPKRYTLFSKFDEGIQMDEVGWYSVTPESVAKYTAERLSYQKIVDMFSGVGGNSIQVG